MLRGQCMEYRARGKPVPINEFLTPDNPTVKNIANELLQRANGNTPKDIMVAAYNFVSQQVKYITDKEYFGKEEWWQYPEETLTQMEGSTPFSRKMYGDCEDTSFLLASLMLSMGFPEDKIRVGISKVHAFVEVKFGEWYILETTEDEPLEEMKSRSAMAGNYVYQPVVYVYNWGCSKW